MVIKNYSVTKSVLTFTQTNMGKPEVERPLGRPRRRWEDNIKMDLQEVWRGSWVLDGVGSG